jgi:hypothetical protein
MAARVPLDVDLEDKLVYGLTPARLAYMAVALVLGYAVWSSHWGPAALRVAAAGVVIALGSCAAWGRWRGRAADRWAVDIVVFVVKNYKLEANPQWGRRRSPQSQPPDLLGACETQQADGLSIGA